MTTPQLSQSPGRQRTPLQPVWICGLALLLAGVPGFAQNQGSTAQGSPPPGSSTSQQQDAQAPGTTTQDTTTPGTTTQGGVEVAGTWQGAIELPQAKLDITVDLAQKQDGTWTGAIDIPQQKAENLLLEPVTVSGNEVKFAIKGLPGDPTFEGKLENGEIAGTFTQAPPIPFELTLNGPGTMGVGGSWQGAINLPQGPLQVTVDLTEANGAWTGTIDIPAQQAQDLALEPVTVNGSEVSFAIKGVPGNPTFKGTVSGTKMTGEFKQGAPTPFRLARGTAQPSQGQQQGQASPPQSQ
ncbi:MAG TPA: hypothetical protein VE685_08195 [Thermoanaerobaculia bacterium]|nr:hypothetical protein [Thermoanaerobaculia bacterium]